MSCELTDEQVLAILPEELACLYNHWVLPSGSINTKVIIPVFKALAASLQREAELKSTTPEEAIKQLAKFAVDRCDDCKMEDNVSDCAWQDEKSYDEKGFWGPSGECIFQMAKDEAKNLEDLE